ncbi:MAG: NHL repeat-containing protein [Nostocoides sp.]
MKVRILTASTPHVGIVPGADAAAITQPYGGWRPRTVLGANAPGGLLLPPATPTRSWLYGPRGVWLSPELVAVADTGNHRVLLWHGLPSQDGAPASVVLGQPDDTSDSPGAGPGRMHLPTGVLVIDGALVVADAWNHRILVWDSVPTLDGAVPDHVIGQPDAERVEPNAGGPVTGSTLYWPFGIAVIDGIFYVADTGNRRVLGWRQGLPLDGRPADVVLGQPDPHSREENRGGEPGPDSFRWPHTITASADGGILVADAGNHRLLGWSSHPDRDLPADHVIGQQDFTTATESPYRPHDGRMVRFPYAAHTVDGALFVADTANNRVLIWNQVPTGPNAHPDHVLAQPDFAHIGENRWESVAADTLCWPYGLGVAGDLLAIADSGNNRIVLWERG